MLMVAIIFGSIHSRGERRALVAAVTQQLDRHTPQIEELLANMRGSDVTLIEDAAFHELQAVPSTSLISRSMIKVAPTADGFLQCVIDTSSFHIAPRIIRVSHPVTPK